MYSCTSPGTEKPFTAFLSVLWKTTRFATKAECFAAMQPFCDAGVFAYCIKQ